MNGSVREAVRRTLEERRSRARVEQAVRLEEISKKVPQVIALRKEMALTSVKLSRMILEHKADLASSLEKLKRDNLSMQEMEKDLLRRAGYPEDYLELHYTCPLCKDTGFTGQGVCSCRRRLEQQETLRRLSDSSPLEMRDFAGFDLRYYDQTPDVSAGTSPRELMARILDYCKNYAETFTPEAKGLLFSGATGLGKTHLSLAVAKRVIERGYDVLYGTAQGFLSAAEEEHFSRERSHQTMDSLLRCDLLVLDDLGSEFASAFSQSALYELVNGRRGPMIVSSNLSVKELQDRYGQRIVSRLLAKCVYMRFLGRDIRQIRAGV